ncbi:MAG: hypothetical protein R3F11_27760 [Verrucomicrobiales bacterium]
MENATVEAIATTSRNGNTPVADRITLGFDRHDHRSRRWRDSVFFDCPQRTFARVTDGGAPPRIARSDLSTTEGQVLTVRFALRSPTRRSPRFRCAPNFPIRRCCPPDRCGSTARREFVRDSARHRVAGSAFVTLIASDGANRVPAPSC